MRTRTLLGLVAAVATLALLAPGAAVALPVRAVITTVPINTYLPRVVVASVEGGLEYRNLDLSEHDVVAEVEDASGQVRANHVRPSDSAPWCEYYDGEPCPLFWTDVLSTGQTSEVLGFEDAVPGTTYKFFCSIHPYMKGELVVVD